MQPALNERSLQHRIEELDQIASVCNQFQYGCNVKLENTDMLDKLADLLGADSAVFRIFSQEYNKNKLSSLKSIGVPSGVTESYLEHFKDLDPARFLIGNPALSYGSKQYGEGDENNLPVNHRQNFIRYRDEFLVPNHLYHHLGFVVPDHPARRMLLFNFHRSESASDFGPLEHARVRLLLLVLQGRVRQLFDNENEINIVKKLESVLSPRELEVSFALSHGLTNKQIANELGISIRTVENHLRAIYRKLQVSSRTRLVAKLNQLREPLIKSEVPVVHGCTTKISCFK